MKCHFRNPLHSFLSQAHNLSEHTLLLYMDLCLLIELFPLRFGLKIYIDIKFCLKVFYEVYRTFLEPSVRAVKEKVL